MILTKLLFIALILVCAAFYILYIWDFALVLLVIMIALPVLMFIFLLITKFLIKVEFAVKSDTVSKEENFPVQICLTNRSFLPIGKAEATIDYYNVFNNEINCFVLHMPIQARNTQRMTFQMNSKFCGIIKISCRFIKIYDPLRLFRFKVGKGISTQVSVMPEGKEIGGSVVFTGRIDEESDIFSENRPGDDPSEVFDLRDYIPGDKLNRIHWKLSSKKDEFIVKDYSLPVDVPSVIFLDLKGYEYSEYTLPIFDTMIEAMVSISQFMLENERIHTLVCFNGHVGTFVEYRITSPDSLSAAVRGIINSVRDDMGCQPAEDYLSDNPDISVSSFTFITSKPDHPVIDYMDTELDADIRNAVIVLKTVEEADRDIFSHASVNTIPVIIGRISSSIKDIEL